MKHTQSERERTPLSLKLQALLFWSKANTSQTKTDPEYCNMTDRNRKRVCVRPPARHCVASEVQRYAS